MVISQLLHYLHRELRKRKALIPATFMLAQSLFFAPEAFSEVRLQQNADAHSYYVHGNESRSFYPKNQTRYLYEGELNFNQPIKTGSEWYGDVFYRATDDPLIDQQDFSIERIYAGYKSGANSALLGDFYSFFSDYSLNNALKGGKVEVAKQGSFKFISLGGIDTPKWEDLWNKRYEDSNTIKYVWGTRLETYFFDEALNLNFNYGGRWDDWATFPLTFPPMSIEVGSIDWKIKPCEYLTFRGEAAQSYSDADARVRDVLPKFDSAYKIVLDFASDLYESKCEYSIIGEHFNTTGGFNARDLESMLYDGTLFLPWGIDVVHYIHMDKDNLKKLKTTTTKQINPGSRVSFTLPGEVRTGLGWDMRKRYSTDTLMGELTNAYEASIVKDFKYYYLSARYAKTTIENYKDAFQDRSQDRVGIDVSGDFDWWKTRIYWSFGEDAYVEQYPKIGGTKNDLIFTSRMGLKAVFPSSFTVDSRIEFNDNDYYLTDIDSTINRYHVAISKDFSKGWNITLTYDQNDYYYEVEGNNHFEILMNGKLSYKF
jgi:hypothetical protein